MGAFDFSVVKSWNKVLQDTFYNPELKLWGKKDQTEVKEYMSLFFFYLGWINFITESFMWFQSFTHQWNPKQEQSNNDQGTRWLKNPFVFYPGIYCKWQLIQRSL